MILRVVMHCLGRCDMMTPDSPPHPENGIPHLEDAPQGHGLGRGPTGTRSLGDLQSPWVINYVYIHWDDSKKMITHPDIAHPWQSP